MRCKLRYSRGAGLFSLVVALAGCKTWQPATSSPELVVREERPASVRVTVDGGASLMLRNPIVVGDSIVASEAPPPGIAFVPPRTGVLFQDVRTLEVARFSPGRTIALAAVIGAVSLGWARVQGAGGSLPDNEPLPKQPVSGLFRGLQIVWRVF